MRRPRFPILAFAILLLVVLLAGCAAPTIPDGTVVQKSHTDAYTSFIPVWHHIGNTSYMTMMPAHHSEQFDIEVRDVESEKTEWWNILPETFEEVSVGDRIHRASDGAIGVVHPPGANE